MYVYVQLILLHIIASNYIINKSYHIILPFEIWNIVRRIICSSSFIGIFSATATNIARQIQLDTFMVFWSKAGWLNCTPRQVSTLHVGVEMHGVFPCVFPIFHHIFHEFSYVFFLDPWTRSHTYDPSGTFRLEIIQYVHTFLTTLKLQHPFYGGEHLYEHLYEHKTFILILYMGSSSLPARGLQFLSPFSVLLEHHLKKRLWTGGSIGKCLVPTSYMIYVSIPEFRLSLKLWHNDLY